MRHMHKAERKPKYRVNEPQNDEPWARVQYVRTAASVSHQIVESTCGFSFVATFDSDSYMNASVDF